MAYGYEYTKTHPRPLRVESGSINFIPKDFESGFGSIFHYKGLGLVQGGPYPSRPVYSPMCYHSKEDAQDIGICGTDEPVVPRGRGASNEHPTAPRGGDAYDVSLVLGGGTYNVPDLPGYD
ncbi:hypothetical protein M9H77_13751 [Catharanthus roseus]|uniref:Uncharacterized protein n=1 Tax=Catharanthus roseus TaxID=4058 RepID=A0ACC0BL17_CATRO|nr:hypothetical protein M9H77_13751 [Catharanthus roseus]